MKTSLLLVLLLAGCTEWAPVGEFDVIVHINQPCEKSVACYEIIDGKPHIWVPSPLNPSDACLWLHELQHVEYGRWHGEQSSNECGIKE